MENVKNVLLLLFNRAIMAKLYAETVVLEPLVQMAGARIVRTDCAPRAINLHAISVIVATLTLVANA
jgi:hypothetical protein